MWCLGIQRLQEKNDEVPSWSFNSYLIFTRCMRIGPCAVDIFMRPGRMTSHRLRPRRLKSQQNRHVAISSHAISIL